jgi:sugar lactone lactonase YvrE
MMSRIVSLAAPLTGMAIFAFIAPVSPGHGRTADAFKSWIIAELPGPPEGLALAADGTIYATIPKTRQVVKLDEHGGFKHVATVPSPELAEGGRVFGLDFGPRDELYVTYLWGYTLAEEEDPFHLSCRNSRDVYTGIYKVNVVTGAVTPFLTKREGWPVCFPDDVAVDAKGAVYVTDLTLSGVWRIDPDGQHFALWSSDPLLQWPAAPLRTLPEGANDLVLSRDGKTLYVATDGYPAVVAIPILEDGRAGPGAAIARDLSPLDGIELDPDGNIYVSEIVRDTIRVFSADGKRNAIVANSSTAPLSGPTSLVYRRGTLCVANFGWDVSPEPTSIVCMSGFPKPSLSH